MIEDLPVVSCIIPVFNGAKYIAEALDSILGQTYQNLEVLVVNDGSTDETLKVLKSYGETISVVSQSNLGPAVARNNGIYATRGRFIAFLDADDLWVRSKLELQVRRFKERPEVQISLGHVHNFWMTELKGEEKKFKNHPKGKAMAAYSTHTLLTTRDVFNSIGVFDESLAHSDDTDWFMRAKSHQTVVDMLPDILAYRRMHQANMSRTGKEQSMDEYFSIVKRQLTSERADTCSPPKFRRIQRKN